MADPTTVALSKGWFMLNIRYVFGLRLWFRSVPCGQSTDSVYAVYIAACPWTKQIKFTTAILRSFYLYPFSCLCSRWIRFWRWSPETDAPSCSLPPWPKRYDSRLFNDSASNQLLAAAHVTRWRPVGHWGVVKVTSHPSCEPFLSVQDIIGEIQYSYFHVFIYVWLCLILWWVI